MPTLNQRVVISKLSMVRKPVHSQLIRFHMLDFIIFCGVPGQPERHRGIMDTASIRSCSWACKVLSLAAVSHWAKIRTRQFCASFSVHNFTFKELLSQSAGMYTCVRETFSVF